MRVESYERHMKKTCRRCNTILDFHRNYCCVKGQNECFADMGLVKRGILQDVVLRENLYAKEKIDFAGNIINRCFFRGFLTNECLVFNYRPPGCRSHFCKMWDEYMKKNPLDFVYANLNVVPTKKMLTQMKLEFQYGIKLAYPGGFIIYTDKPKKIKKELSSMLDGMKIKHFSTDAELMDPKDNKRPGVEIIMDSDAVIEKPGLFGTIIKNNMFMLVRMKMNMGSTGFRHANIMITTADPQRVADETPASLKAFHSLVAFQL
jgi:hypothetical protein